MQFPRLSFVCNFGVHYTENILGTCRSSRLCWLWNFSKRRNDGSWRCHWMGERWWNCSFPCKLILLDLLKSEIITKHLFFTWKIFLQFHFSGSSCTWRIWTHHRRESRCNSSSSQSEWYSHNTTILQTLCYVWWKRHGYHCKSWNHIYLSD